MGGLVAVLSKNGSSILPEALRMLASLRHRGGASYGIATDKTVIYAEDLYKMERLLGGSSSRIALGYTFRRILPEDMRQPIDVGGIMVVLEGRVYSPSAGRDRAYRIIEKHGEEGVKKVIAEAHGDFTIAALSGGKLLIGRDSIGVSPLYFSENERYIAFASERKALWSIGIEDENIRSLPPGSLAEATGRGVVIERVKALERPGAGLDVGEESILNILDELLLDAVKRRLYGLLDEGISVAFSGGLDSSVIAALLKRLKVNVTLVTVGLEGSKELDHSERVAEEIGLRTKIKTYGIEDVEETLPRVLWLIEEADALRASIKIPECWAVETSSEIGCRVIFFGEGGDELFGGYYKYLREIRRSREDAEAALFFDTINLYKSLEMNEKICAFHGVEPRFPYADYSLATFALKIPISIKILSAEDPLRKRILRRYAERIGLPTEVYLRPKKAIQYGTGVSKALKKIAKRSGLSIQGLIDRVFREVRGQYPL